MRTIDDQVRLAVEETCDCEARLKEAVAVSETFQGEVAWEGIVYVFVLINHPAATRAYGWMVPVQGSKKERIVVVLEVPPIKSAVDALRAAIVQEYRSQSTS